tara:strand:+ start:1034 stop:1306 length:273 start_codon:yes stop_codon:yes gene_type:complete
MYKKIINIFFLFSFLAFMFLVSKYYFSEKNYIFTNKSRSSYTLLINEHGKSLPLLKNDTANIIVYKNELEEFKKKRKKRFWEKLISNLDE